MSHLKRIAMPRSWPMPKTGTKYLVKARPGRKNEFSLPLLIVLRDLLDIVKTKSEAKKVLFMKEVSVNGKIVGDYKFPVSIFDIISIPKMKKSYKIIVKENGKLGIEETKDETKLSKVIGKTILSGKKTQINLFDGNNMLSNDKIKINDSIVMSLKDKKIVKILPLKEKARVSIIGGKNIGKEGIIEKIEDNQVIVNIEKKDVNIRLNNILVIE